MSIQCRNIYIQFYYILIFIIGCLSCSNEKDHNTESYLPLNGSSDNTVLKINNSPYVIEDTLFVASSETLKINPGVIIKFKHNAVLIVRGMLDARGTESDYIQFTTITSDNDYDYKTYWNGIHIINNSDNSILQYCIIEKCMDQLIYIENSSPTISHCKLHKVLSNWDTGGCLLLSKGESFPLIEYNIMTEFSNYLACAVLCCCECNANPKINHNDIYCNQFYKDIAVKGGGFLNGNYLAAEIKEGKTYHIKADTSSGHPIDIIGDSICTTNSTSDLQLFINVDGIKNTKSVPNFP